MLKPQPVPAALPARFFPGFAPQPDGGDPPANPPANPPADPPAPPATPPATPPTPPAPPELPADVKAQLDEYKKLKADAEKRDREAMSEAERLKKDLDAANARALASDRRAVAARLGLPPEVADRLKGNSLEEIEADAKALQPLFKVDPPPKGNTGTPAGSEPPPAPEKGAVEKKKQEIDEALKKGDMLGALKLKRELAALEAGAKK